MGWKLYLIIITNAANVNTTEIPAKLGLESIKPTKEINLLEAQTSRKTCIGKHGGNIYIVSEELVFKFYDKAPSEFEKKLSAAFPKSDIAVLTLNSTVDLYGYSIISNGNRQRIKFGADSELYVDFGNKLQEEMDISKEKLFDDDELKEMKADMSKADFKKMVDQEISFRTTNRLTGRYLGKQIDQKGSLIGSIKVFQYE
jgi:hypothetical protein